MSEPPEIRVSCIEIRKPGSSLPRSLSCHVQKTEDTTEGGLTRVEGGGHRACTPPTAGSAAPPSVVNTDAGSPGGTGATGAHGILPF